MNRCTKVPFSNWFGLNCKVNSVVAYILMFRRHRSHNTSVIGSFFDWPESPFKWKNLDRIDKLRAYKELDHFVEEKPIISTFEPVQCPVNLNWKKHFLMCGNLLIRNRKENDSLHNAFLLFTEDLYTLGQNNAKYALNV